MRDSTSSDPVYLERKEQGLIELRGAHEYEERPGAKRSVLIFLIAIIAVVTYAALISENLHIISDPTLPRTEAIMSIMLAAAMAITILCRIDPSEILGMQTFRSGMSACVCVLGVAWLGTTFVSTHMEAITAFAGSALTAYPWLLAVVLFFAAALLYSQAATTKALMPTAIALGASPIAAIAAFPAVSALFVLPTYPTLLAAVEMDDTGSTRVGRAIFNHPFMIPGIVNIALAVGLGFLFGSLML
ncbi:anaerobic C4-dicarboxylate transporter family protein [Bowdeniella nasicola]|uniref:anaerobic C4-dicarboxylate transporter family protein n=1 Tax=Bowdeniella nasicola TaxID=208480 RepID=UPI0009F918C8|nr:anaerobic C4-dicarboxylate transporter family protein [Bowdeniella nasicola]